MAASLKVNASAQSAAVATASSTTVSVTTATTTAPAVGDLVVAIAFDAIATGNNSAPTIAGTTGGGTWTVAGQMIGQPSCTVATKTLTAAGQVTVTATTPQTGALYLYVFVGTGGYLSIDDVEFGFENVGNTTGASRATSAIALAPASAINGASTTYPQQEISAGCTWSDGAAVPTTYSTPTGGTLASATPTSPGTSKTISRAFTYVTATVPSTGTARSSTISRAVYSLNVQFGISQARTFAAIQDDFSSGTIDATRWPTRNSVSYNATYGCAQVQANQSGGNPVYAAMRSPYNNTLLGSSMYCRIPHFPDAVGDTVNAQIWCKVDDSAGGAAVNRVGFEYVGATNQLVFRGQTANYAPIGTDVSITYSAQHRWLYLMLTQSAGLSWYTSPDMSNWNLQRNIPYAQVPAFLKGANTLAASFEAFRTTGANDYMLVNSVNVTPQFATTPVWMISTTPTGKATWTADLTKTDAVAAGYQNMNWNIEPSGIVPFPPPVVPAPYGRAGNAVQLRLPDAGKRNELQPNGVDYQDGDSFWEGLAFCLGPETDLQATAGSGYQVIWQLRPENDTGSPPASLEVRNGNLLLTGGYNRPDPTGVTGQGGTYSYSQTLLTGLQKQTWYHVILFVGVWSAYNSGRIDVWVNGASVLSNFVPPPGTNYPQPSGQTPTGSYLKCGIYHDIANRGMTNYIADHKVGTSYNAVNPAQPITGYGGLEVLGSGR